MESYSPIRETTKLERNFQSTACGTELTSAASAKRKAQTNPRDQSVPKNQVPTGLKLAGPKEPTGVSEGQQFR